MMWSINFHHRQALQYVREVIPTEFLHLNHGRMGAAFAWREFNLALSKRALLKRENSFGASLSRL
jgi:hypothetical protein